MQRGKPQQQERCSNEKKTGRGQKKKNQVEWEKGIFQTTKRMKDFSFCNEVKRGSLLSKADEVLMVGVYVRQLDVNQKQKLKRHVYRS